MASGWPCFFVSLWWFSDGSSSVSTVHSVILLGVCVCDQLCDVNCTGSETYDMHCAGKQHCKVCQLCLLCHLILLNLIIFTAFLILSKFGILSSLYMSFVVWKWYDYINSASTVEYVVVMVPHCECHPQWRLVAVIFIVCTIKCTQTGLYFTHWTAGSALWNWFYAF